MIAGRFRGRRAERRCRAKSAWRRSTFRAGTLLLTEAGSKRQASLYVVRGEEALDAHDPGGLEVVDVDARGVCRRRCGARTTRSSARSPTRICLSGIGNAYSDEILHAAKMSPMKLTAQMTDDEIAAAARRQPSTTLITWRDRLIDETGERFPEEGHGVSRRDGGARPIRQALPGLRDARAADSLCANEANYCPTCQTGGRLLADRSLSRLLKDDWPRSLEELERRKRQSCSIRASSTTC